MNRKATSFRFRILTLLLFVFTFSVAFCVWLNWEYFPGTYYRDANGFHHGTGSTTHEYASGQLMIQEWYWGGLIYRSTWYRPDGSEIATEKYSKREGGIGYFLRQDGSIKSKYTYAYSAADNIYVADGKVTFYNVDGTVAKVVQYEDGGEVENTSQ